MCIDTSAKLIVGPDILKKQADVWEDLVLSGGFWVVEGLTFYYRVQYYIFVFWSKGLPG